MGAVISGDEPTEACTIELGDVLHVQDEIFLPLGDVIPNGVAHPMYIFPKHQAALGQYHGRRTRIAASNLHGQMCFRTPKTFFRSSLVEPKRSGNGSGAYRTSECARLNFGSGEPRHRIVPGCEGSSLLGTSKMIRV